MIVKFCLSCDLFWGWTQEVDISKYSTFDNIIDYIRSRLISYFNKANLCELVLKVKALKLHCHDDRLDNILSGKLDISNMEYDSTIYLCDSDCTN